jgi:biopolymer transport protein ExbD
MSHGGGGEGPSMEPNLTPLLDMVLQLLMFFMMCVNFVNEQAPGDIKLPVSQSARPMDKSETDVLFIGVKPFHLKDFEGRDAEEREKLKRNFQEGDPCILIVGKFPMKIIELQQWLKDQYRDAELKAKAAGDPNGKVTTAIIIRAHQDTEYAQVYQVLNLCKVAGFRQMKLRAITKAG